MNTWMKKKVRKTTNLLRKVSLERLNNGLEIIEYAKFLGMDPDEDADLLYIAIEGVTPSF